MGDILVSLHRLADLLKANYINEDMAKLLSESIIKFTASETFQRFRQTKDIDKLIWELNDILFAISNDRHLSIYKKSSNPVLIGDGSGLEKATKNYIKLNKFGSISSDEVRKIFWEALNKIEEMLIIDLRNCPGGDFDLAYFILCHLYPDGEPLIEISRRYGDDLILYSKSDFSYYCSYNTIKKFTGEVKVLINSNTASAAETTAFVLKNTARAKIYGCKTQGSNYMTSRWDIDDLVAFIPYAIIKDPRSHESFQNNGINPDYSIGSKEYIELLMNEIVKH